MVNRMVMGQVIGNARLSLLRPGWTQYDLNAYQHLHLRDKIVKDHFVKTEGFRTMEDLRYAKRRYRR